MPTPGIQAGKLHPPAVQIFCLQGAANQRKPVLKVVRMELKVFGLGFFGFGLLFGQNKTFKNEQHAV